MPTAYTAKLEEMNFDVKDWMLRIVPRAFGVCVMLRDDSLSLTLDQIRERIATIDPYHQKEVERIALSLEKFSSYTPGDWQNLLEKHNQFLVQTYELERIDVQDKRAKYEEALRTLKAMEPQDETSRAIVNYAIDQLLQTMRYDLAVPKNPSPLKVIDWESLQAERIDKAKTDLQYHTEQHAKECAKAKERIRTFDAYIEFIEKAFSEGAAHEQQS